VSQATYTWLPALPPLVVGELDVRAALLGLLLGGGLLSLCVAALAPGPPRPRAPSRLEVHLAEELRRARLHEARLRDVAAAAAVLAVLGWLALMSLSGWVVYAAAGAALGAMVPLVGISLRAQHFHARVQVALVDAIRQLRDALRAASVRRGIELLATKGPPALQADFQRVLDREGALGGLDPALRELRARLADPIADQLIDALLVSLATGGGLLGQTLDDLAAQAEGDLEIRAAIRTEQWEVRATALVLALVPAALLLYLKLVSPEAVAAFDLPLGQALLLGCAVLCVAGYVGVLKVARLPERPRLYGGGQHK
jgi:tight adherence protein B